MPASPPDYFSALHLLPTADAEIVEAVYRILARRLASESASPDARRRLMELNTAYSVLSHPARRAAYARELSDGTREPADHAGAARTPAAAATAADEPSRKANAPAPPDQLTFGRYAGWRLSDILRHDPEYLWWLRRHSSGMRYRGQIERLLREAGTARRHVVRPNR